MPREEEGSAELKGDETILLVEDEESVRSLVREFLEEQGYKVLVARDGAQGLKVSREFRGRIDLLITDVIMPKLGGVELAEQLRKKRPGLLVQFISGYAEGEIEMEKGGAGQPPLEEPLLQKPFRMAVLAASIRRLLERNKSSKK